MLIPQTNVFAPVNAYLRHRFVSRTRAQCCSRTFELGAEGSTRTPMRRRARSSRRWLKDALKRSIAASEATGQDPPPAGSWPPAAIGWRYSGSGAGRNATAGLHRGTWRHVGVAACCRGSHPGCHATGAHKWQSYQNVIGFYAQQLTSAPYSASWQGC